MGDDAYLWFNGVGGWVGPGLYHHKKLGFGREGRGTG